MNGNPSDDRLSAYFDDELSLEERAQMEEMLATSPELRADLDAYRQMSEQLKSLPKEKAPSELYGSIMRGIEREVLLPRRDASAKKSRWRSLIAVAACGLIAATALTIFQREKREVAEVAPVSRQLPASRQLANQNQTVVGKEGSGAGQAFQINQSDLVGAKPGDQVKAVSVDGITVIRLTVVESRDIQTAVRVLLAGESVKPLTTPTEENGNGIVAVYLRSNSAQVTSAIEKMKRELDAETLSSPVMLESSDPQLQEVLAATAADKGTQEVRLAVPVQPGSNLEKLARSSTSAETPANVGRQGSIQVLFLIVKQPTAPKVDEKKPNGAA